MSLKDLEPRHLKLIGLYATRYAVRGGAGLIFVIIVLLAGLLIANIVVSATVDRIEQATREAGGSKEDAKKGFEILIDYAEPMVSWVLGERETVPIEMGPPGAEGTKTEDRWAAYLLREKPALLSTILLIIFWVWPWMCAIGSFNQYAGDVGSRGIRYQLLRTERANIYFGRYLGTVIFSSLTIGVLIFTIVAYLGLALDYYEWGPLISWGLQGWLALTVLTFPYVAVCGWISGAINSAFGSLVLCILVVLAPVLIASIGGLKTEQAKYARWLLPWACQNYLFHYTISKVLLTVLACFGYTAVFLTAGYLHFTKRDL